MNQTFFEWYEFDVNAVRILIATLSYKLTLWWLGMNQNTQFNSNVLVPLIFKISWVLMSSEKTIHYWPLLCISIYQIRGRTNSFKVYDERPICRGSTLRVFFLSEIQPIPCRTVLLLEFLSEIQPIWAVFWVKTLKVK